jgi:hypothetical protein
MENSHAIVLQSHTEQCEESPKYRCEKARSLGLIRNAPVFESLVNSKSSTESSEVDKTAMIQKNLKRRQRQKKTGRAGDEEVIVFVG